MEERQAYLSHNLGQEGTYDKHITTNSDDLWQQQTQKASRRGLYSVGLIPTLDPNSRNYQSSHGGSGKSSHPVA